MLGKGFGGAERAFVDLCAALVARGHAVLAIAERRAAALPLLRAIDGLAIETIAVWGAWDPHARHVIHRHLRTFAPAVVQCHLARAALLGGRAARSLGIPTLAKTHNYVDLKYYRAISRLIPTTASQASYLEAQGIPADRITRIPNFSRLAPRSAEQVPGSPRLVAAGRFVQKKGFDVLLRAFARLREDHRPLELTLIGDGPERVALEALTRQLGLQAHVHFAGWTSEVAPGLAQATLFVLPSRDEPFGIVVLEAMALGVPIVATRTAGPSEMLDERCAWLVAIEDEVALAAALAAALASPATRAQRARAAAMRFRERYSEAAVVTAYERVYEALAARRAE